MRTRLAAVGFGLLSIASSATPPAYTIRTIAGSDNVGDGGPATAAFAGILEGVCVDAAGNVYLADANDNRIRKIDAKGIISTFAGTGTAGFSGDNGPANQALLNAPYGIRLDAGGILYIADLGNGRIRRVTPDGKINTIAASLNQPRNLAFDPSGNLYVSEFGAHRVSRVNADGSLTPFAGTGVAGESGDGGPARTAQLTGPAGIVFDSSGTLYIADSGNGLIRRVTPDGVITTFIGRLAQPTGVAINSTGNLCVAQRQIQFVFCSDSTGTKYQPLPGIGDDLFALAGSLYIAGQEHLEVVAPDGTLSEWLGRAATTFGDGGPATQAHFETVSGVAVDSTGTVTVADPAFRRLRAIAPNGVITSLQASDFMSDPRALALDPSGNLYVADGGRIAYAAAIGPTTTVVGGLAAPAALAFNSSGKLYFIDSGQADMAVPSATAGAPPALDPVGPALNNPAGIAVSSSGDVYLADSGNHRILRVIPDGTTAVFAGTGTAGFAGDEGPAALAQLNQPSGLAFDSSNNLWVADTANQRIRYIDSSGAIHTAAGNGTSGFSGDDGPAAEAQLSSPTSIACDANGNIYVGDAGNRRVRLLTSSAPNGQNTNGVITVTHAATFLPGSVVGGEIVTLFGANIGPANALGAKLDNNGDVATQLGGVQVLFDGIPAPLYYVGLNQINAQVPVEVGGRLATPVQIFQGGVLFASTNVDVVPYSPGIFALGGFAAALNQDGSVNSANHPAHPNSVIVLFGTGFGATLPAEKTGVPAAPPLARPLAKVSVLINGEPAQIQYAGDAPGFAGLTQINALIPGDIASSGPVEVRVGAGAILSPSGVYLQIQ